MSERSQTYQEQSYGATVTPGGVVMSSSGGVRDGTRCRIVRRSWFIAHRRRRDGAAEDPASDVVGDRDIRPVRVAWMTPGDA